MDLLLDETICAGTVAVPREMVRLAGGVNKRLGAKQKYELLLRIAAETPVELEETDEDACGQENMMVFDDAEEPENTGLGWRTDCYVLESTAHSCRKPAILMLPSRRCSRRHRWKGAMKRRFPIWKG